MRVYTDLVKECKAAREADERIYGIMHKVMLCILGIPIIIITATVLFVVIKILFIMNTVIVWPIIIGLFEIIKEFV